MRSLCRRQRRRQGDKGKERRREEGRDRESEGKMIERKRGNACVLRRECSRVCVHAYMRMLEHGDAHIRTYICTHGATSCVRTCGTVYDSLQFIVWTSICQVSGRGRYRRFRRIFGVENYQLSQWNSIRIVHQRLCRPRARERVSVQTHTYTHIQHTRTRARTHTNSFSRTQAAL